MTRIGYALSNKNAGESIKSATQIRSWAKHLQDPSAANPSADAAAQRDRSLGDDAENWLAAMQPACALISLNFGTLNTEPAESEEEIFFCDTV